MLGHDIIFFGEPSKYRELEFLPGERRSTLLLQTPVMNQLSDWIIGEVDVHSWL